MAQLIVIGPNYFVAFASGQGAVASDAYFTFAPDLDATLLTLLNTVNLHTNEINAVQGPVGILPLDIMQYDDSILRPTPVVSGLIGIDSYFPTIQTAPNDNRVDVRAGVALAASDRVNQPTPVTLTATDQLGSETDERFLAINNQGVPTLEILADQQVVDLWHFDFATPSEVLSNPTRLANVLFDGDDYDQLRIRRGTAPFFEGIDSVEFVDGNGSDTLERTVGDWTADGFVNGETFAVDRSSLNDGTYTITGITALVITVTGASFANEGPSTGIRITGGHFRYSDFDQFHERIEQLEDILAGLEPSSLRMLFPAGTAALSSIAPVGDPNTGIYWPAADEVALTAGGVHVVRAHGGASEPEQLRAADGTETNPVYSFPTDPTSGIRSPGVDRLALVVNETDAISIDTTGNVDLPTNSRVKGLATSLSQSFADAAATNARFNDADAFDVGAWHIPGDDTAGEEYTVPTGADGLYAIVLGYDWAAPATNPREMLQEITVDNTQIAKSERNIAIGEEYSDTVVAYVDLTAAEVVRGRLTQTDSVGALALVLEGVSLSIVKQA